MEVTLLLVVAIFAIVDGGADRIVTLDRQVR